MCRGIDVTHTRLVVHYDIPARGERLDEDTYQHRCGRATRFDRAGKSLVFKIKGDRHSENLIRQASLPGPSRGAVQPS